MHLKGTDLPSISKQTGHKSIQTISEHYLNVSDKTIDKYLQKKQQENQKSQEALEELEMIILRLND